MEENEMIYLIFSFFIDVIITAFLYMIVPIIIFFVGKKELTEKQIKKYTIINSIVVFIVIIILLIILDSDVSSLSGLSAFFYGSINYWLLSKHKKQEDEIYIDKEYEKAGNEKLEKLINNLQDEKIQENKKQDENKKIDNKLDEKVPMKKALLIIFGFIFICISILGNIILINKIDEQKLQIQTKDNQINILNNRISNLEKKNRENAINNLSNYKKNNFMDKYVVIIPKNTNVYHKYGCQYLDLSSCLIFNIENARAQGYKPCSHCIKD